MVMVMKWNDKMKESNKFRRIIPVLEHRLASIVNGKGSEANILSSNWLVTVTRASKCSGIPSMKIFYRTIQIYSA